MKKSLLLSIIIAVGCSSAPKKVILDTSGRDKPDWVESSKLAWKEDKKNFFRGDYTIQGNERASACIDLAKLNVKEQLITEIQEELKGATENASDSIREDAEILLNKSRSASYRGQISGLRFTSSYWEKYALVTKEQKISCYVLGVINEANYMQTKRNVVNKITRANPKLKEAVTNKQVKFFEN